MARNPEPMTPEEFETLQEEMEEQSQELREALAEDLGGDPADYRPGAALDEISSSEDGEAVPDGGE